MSICHCSSSYSKAAINLGLCGVMAHISVQLGSNHPIHNIFILFKGNVNSPQRGFQKNLISVYQLQQYFNNIVETLRCIHFFKTCSYLSRNTSLNTDFQIRRGF